MEARRSWPPGRGTARTRRPPTRPPWPGRKGPGGGGHPAEIAAHEIHLGQGRERRVAHQPPERQLLFVESPVIAPDGLADAEMIRGGCLDDRLGAAGVAQETEAPDDGQIGLLGRAEIRQPEAELRVEDAHQGGLAGNRPGAPGAACRRGCRPGPPRNRASAPPALPCGRPRRSRRSRRGSPGISSSAPRPRLRPPRPSG